MDTKKTEITSSVEPVKPKRKPKKQTIKTSMAEGKPIVKSVSFKEENYPELIHLLKQKNASDYICDLIRRDRTIESVDNTPDLIKKAVKEQLANLLIAVPQPGTEGLWPVNNTTVEHTVDAVDEEILEDYFGDE